MDLDKLYKKLEAYEELGYEGGSGIDWLAEIGENFKLYVFECKESNIEPTFKGWVDHVDKLARNFHEINITINYKKSK